MFIPKCFYGILIFFSFISSSWSINPAHIVYRVDTRNITEIQRAGGMWPRYEQGRPDDYLIHHFDGESVEDGTSNFVSTSRTLADAVSHALFRLDDDNRETYYIYAIRPNTNFYDVDASLQAARNNTSDAQVRMRYNGLLRDYAGMEEIVARGGIRSDQIIQYAELRYDMLPPQNQSRTFLFSDSYWASRWLNNPSYNHHYDGDTSNSNVYENVGLSGSSVLEVVNSNEQAIRLGFTCMGVSSHQGPSSRSSLQSTCPAFYIKHIPYEAIWRKKIATAILQ